jgi:subtilisin family serine protease
MIDYSIRVEQACNHFWYTLAMKKIAWLLLPLSVMLAVLLAQTPRGIAQEADRALNSPKIDRWIIDQTAGDQLVEFLIVLADRADLREVDRLTTKAAKGRYVYETLLAHAQRTQRPVIEWLQQRGVEYRSFYIVNAIWVKANRETALALAARSDVARLDGNPLIFNDVAQPAKSIGPQPERADSIEPGVQYVNAPQVWSLGFSGQGVVIGGQDTGYLWNHAALKPHYRGWDGIAVTHDYNWHDSIHTNTHGVNSCGVDSPVPCDDYGHGTHTMGSAVGDDDGLNQIGVAPGAQWIGCRNMDNGWGTPATYLECFEFFLAPYPVSGTPKLGDPDKAPDVTNNSWSCPDYEGCNPATLLEAVQAQRAAGIMTVVSATNDGWLGCGSIAEPPAIYAEAYTVGALNTGTDSIASFSSLGPVTSDGSQRRKPDISAPGTSIRSSTRDGGYGFSSGTSMAAPHVAGAVALLWSARPELKHQITLTEQLLDESAVPLWSTACGSSGWPNNTFGYGRLDVQATLFGVSLSDAQSQSGDPGSVVTYTLHLTNTGITTDSFTITLTPGQWQSTSIFTSTGQLAANQSTSITVNTLIPADALAYTSDSFTVTAASQTKSQRLAATRITTSANSVRGGQLLPSLAEQIAVPGLWVTYTLRLTNTGNVTQSYALGLLSTRPAQLNPYSTTLRAGQSHDVIASVFLPPLLLENATTYVLAWYDTFTGTLASFARLDTIVAAQRHYLPLILR